MNYFKVYKRFNFYSIIFNVKYKNNMSVKYELINYNNVKGRYKYKNYWVIKI